MDCKSAEELLPAYALSALSVEEAALVEEHLETCPWCPPLLRDHLLVPAALAQVAESVELPPGLKMRTMKAVEGQAKRSRRRESPIFAAGGLLVGATAAVGVLFLASVIAVGVHMSNQMDDLREENSELTGSVLQLSNQIQSMQTENSALTGSVLQLSSRMEGMQAENSALTASVSLLSQRDDKLVGMFRDQISVTYLLASPTREVLVLQAGSDEPRARGMLLTSGRGSSGMLMATGLTPSSEDMVYEVWLTTTDDRRIALGHLVVDDMGWGVLNLLPNQPINLFEQVWVTAEEGQAKAGSTEPKPILWATIPSR